MSTQYIKQRSGVVVKLKCGCQSQFTGSELERQNFVPCEEHSGPDQIAERVANSHETRSVRDQRRREHGD